MAEAWNKQNEYLQRQLEQTQFMQAEMLRSLQQNQSSRVSPGQAPPGGLEESSKKTRPTKKTRDRNNRKATLVSAKEAKLEKSLRKQKKLWTHNNLPLPPLVKKKVTAALRRKML